MLSVRDCEKLLETDKLDGEKLSELKDALYRMAHILVDAYRKRGTADNDNGKANEGE